MRQLEQVWTIRNVDFHLVEGDLFGVPVDAIVNSEQTDFYLSGNPNTISGQIYRRFGESVQEELDDQTQKQVLPVGTVLSTRAGDGFEVIYHVGFHEPDVYPMEDDDQTEYLHILRRCVRQVLDLAVKDGLKSVAFPLLGTGLFGLDPSLLAYEFMAEVAQFAHDTNLAPRIAIWLVVRGEDFTQPALDGVVQALIDRATSGSSWQSFILGVSYLDLYEQHCARSDHPTWAAWQLCRYCELLTGFIYYNLAVGADPPEEAHKAFRLEMPITFGAVRTRAVRLANALSSIRDQTWLALYVSIMQQDHATARRLERINKDRNNIAHGRKSREATGIRLDFCDFLKMSLWREHLQRLGPPEMNHLDPWLHKHDPAQSALATAEPVIAILDQLDKHTALYLVPHTGNLITVDFTGR